MRPHSPQVLTVSDVNIDGVSQGNKTLVLIGDAPIRLAIVDMWHELNQHGPCTAWCAGTRDAPSQSLRMRNAASQKVA